MSYDFKKIADLELVNEVPEGANVLIETEGATKRLPSTAINNGYSKDEVYNKVESDEKYVAKEDVVQSDFAQNDPAAADYIKNRTHYEETKVVNEPLNIAWDGNTEGLVSVADMFYKVSDLVLTDEQIKSATMTANHGASFAITDMWETMVSHGAVTEDAVMLLECGICARKSDVIVGDVTIPEAGIYFASMNGTYVSSFTTTEPVEQTKTVLKKLDKKFLPDDVGGLFKVNISYDEANSRWVSDKTYNEIKAAEEAKMPIIGTFTHMYGNVYTLMGCDAAPSLACRLSAFDVSIAEAPIIYSIVVLEDGDVFVSELTLAATVNEIPPIISE